MSFERVHRSRSQSPQTSSSTSQFAPRAFSVQEPKHPPTKEDIENEAFQQNKFEAFGLQLKEKSGTITPVEQERLGVLQAKMDSFWAQRMEQAKAQPNLLEILIRNAQSAQTTESKTTTPSNAIQAKGNTEGDRQKSSVELPPNKIGLPDNLKAGAEILSGYSLADVRVYYNSPKPSQLNALAYTQGTEIYVAPGQEKHLPHEAWHVVQQKQGCVKPTMQLEDNININDDARLEKEADVMGVKALQFRRNDTTILETKKQYKNSISTAQRAVIGNNRTGTADTKNPQSRNLLISILNNSTYQELQQYWELLMQECNGKHNTEYLQIIEGTLAQEYGLSAIGEKTRSEGGVWTMATIFFEKRHYHTTEPTRNDWHGEEDEFGKAFIEKGTKIYDKEIDNSKRDSEVGTIAKVKEWLMNNATFIKPGHRIHILITGNLGTCTGCHKRMQTFHQWLQEQFKQVNFAIRTSYTTPPLTVERKDIETTYGSGSDKQTTSASSTPYFIHDYGNY